MNFFFRTVNLRNAPRALINAFVLVLFLTRIGSAYQPAFVVPMASVTKISVSAASPLQISNAPIRNDRLTSKPENEELHKKHRRRQCTAGTIAQNQFSYSLNLLSDLFLCIINFDLADALALIHPPA